MKHSELIAAQPVGLRRPDAALMVGGEAVLDEMIARKLIKPAIARHKLTVFDAQALREAWRKLIEMPDQSNGQRGGV